MSFIFIGNGKVLFGNFFFLILFGGGLLLGIGMFVDVVGMFGNVLGVGLIGGVVCVVQLVQMGMLLFGCMLVLIVDVINGMFGVKFCLMQVSCFVCMELLFGLDVLLVNVLVVDEYVSCLLEIYFDLLLYQSEIEIDKIVGQQVLVLLEFKFIGGVFSQLVVGLEIGQCYFQGYVVLFG